jgi:hypothetical protein
MKHTINGILLFSFILSMINTSETDNLTQATLSGYFPEFNINLTISSDNQLEDATSVSNTLSINCGGASLCNTQYGYCYNNECTCKNGFGSSDIYNVDKCNYKKAKQIKFLLLEFFVGFGSGHVYVRRYMEGYLKLSIFLSILILNIIIFSTRICYKKNRMCIKISSWIILAISIAIVVVWQLIDLILIGLNKYKDGNGVELLAWDE